jgi:hypothetical protein
MARRLAFLAAAALAVVLAAGADESCDFSGGQITCKICACGRASRRRFPHA